jgi:hypothetical protein
MQCDQFETRLNDRLDAGRSPVLIAGCSPVFDAAADADLVAHAQQCASCRSLATAFGAVIEGAGQLPALLAPIDMASRVVNELAEPESKELAGRTRWSTTRRTTYQLLAVAAALLVAVSLWLLRHRDENRTIVRQPAAEQAAPIQHLATAATGQYRDLAVQTRDSLASALLILPGEGLLGTNQPTPTAADESLIDPQFGRAVTAGFEPLTRSTAGALDSLWQALPLAAEESRS